MLLKLKALGCSLLAPREELLHVVAVVAQSQRRVTPLGEQVIDKAFYDLKVCHRKGFSIQTKLVIYFTTKKNFPNFDIETFLKIT